MGEQGEGVEVSLSDEEVSLGGKKKTSSIEGWPTPPTPKPSVRHTKENPHPEIVPEAYERWRALKPKASKERVALREMCSAANLRNPSPTVGGLYEVTDCPRCKSNGRLSDFYIGIETSDTRTTRPMEDWSGLCMECWLSGSVPSIFYPNGVLLEVEL